MTHPPTTASRPDTLSATYNLYPQAPTAWLMLEDGTCYPGQAIGAAGTTYGELVFNTALTGYQEILTDPSYYAQVVLMTYPEIGNYGVNPQDFESERIHAAGFVVKRLSPVTSSWRAEITLQDFLRHNQVVGIEGVDTRAITRKIREVGTLKVGITTDATLLPTFLASVQGQADISTLDCVGRVTTPKIYTLTADKALLPVETTGKKGLKRLAVVDFGIKQNILRSFLHEVEELVVLPASATFEDLVAQQPDGVFLSNGPGDPAILHGAVAMARQLIPSGIPTFGICLGHQILSIASGATVTKMRFGHHGANHPVKDLETGTISITSQNHNYATQFEGLPEHLVVTHVNLNDGSIEGVRHKQYPVSSVQFHPEASPGPHDAHYLFARFVSEALR